MSSPTFARIAADVVLGKDVCLPGFCNLYGCAIGDESTIGPFVEVQSGARIGKKVKVQSHSFVCSGVFIDDEAFIGHGVMFINDRLPRSTTPAGMKKGGDDWQFQQTHVGRRASIGSNATILGGLTIGEGAVVGAGSVVTRNVPAHTVVAGNPARVLRQVRPEDEDPALPAPAATPIPFIDLKAQHAELKSEMLTVFAAALDSAGFIGGPALGRFESAWGEFCGVRHALGVSSGTDALRFALLAMGVGPGDVVYVVPNTFVATAAAVTQTGAQVAFVDVDPATCLLDPNRLEQALKNHASSRHAGLRPKAVIPVHLFGQCVDMDAILDIARRHELRVLEDAAQAHGSTWKGRRAGSMGDAAAFSFYPGKNLGACGDGGAVTTNDPEIARHVALLRDHGRAGKYAHAVLGHNGRLDAVQAGVLAIKLQRLPDWNDCRRRLAARYDAGLRGCTSVVPVRQLPEARFVYHLYVVRASRRDELQTELAAAGVATGIHYPIPLHLQECFRSLGLPRGSYPHAERASAEVLSLPIFPEMTDRQVDRVLEVLRGHAAMITHRRAA